MALFDTLKTILTPYAEKLSDLVSDLAKHPYYTADKHVTVIEGEDFNDNKFWTRGSWKIPSANVAQSLVNSPSMLSGVLYCIESTTAYRIQLFIANTTNDCTNVYIRSRYTTSSATSAWYEVTNKKKNKSIQSDILRLSNGSEYYDSWTRGYRYAVVGSTTNVPVAEKYNGFECMDILCNEGDRFLICAVYGSASAKGWFFIDDNGVILSKTQSGSGLIDNVEIVAPENAVKLILNNHYDDSEGAHIIKLNPQVNQ